MKRYAYLYKKHTENKKNYYIIVKTHSIQRKRRQGADLDYFT